MRIGRPRSRLGARRRHDPGGGAGLQLRHVRRELRRPRGGPHALLRPRLPLPQERQVRAHHRRLAPREPRRLPGLPQGRSPRAAVEGAADIRVGFGGSTSAAGAVTTRFLKDSFVVFVSAFLELSEG